MSYLQRNPEFAKALDAMLRTDGTTLRRPNGDVVRVLLPKQLRHMRTTVELADHVRETEASL